MARNEPAEIYQFRAVLRAISPLIWRRLLVRSDSTLAALHEILQVAFGWEDVHLNRFEIRGRGYEVYRDGGGMTGIDAEEVRLCDLHLRPLERFDYEYDFGDGWIHDIRLERVLPTDPKMTYPTCVAGKCAAPPEDCGGPYVFMSNRARYCDIGSGESREDLNDWVDTNDLDDEELEILGRYHPDRFDRRAINRALAQLSAESTEGDRREVHDSDVD
jgi:hypothetical protein